MSNKMAKEYPQESINMPLLLVHRNLRRRLTRPCGPRALIRSLRTVGIGTREVDNIKNIVYRQKVIFGK